MNLRTLAFSTAVAACAAAVPAGIAHADMMGPVATMKDPALGRVLATHAGKALYVWNAEAPGKVRCVGRCAKVWPPLIVASPKAVPMHVDGVMGDFGTIRRPDGRLQVTYNRRPLYTFRKDPKGVAKCNGVDRWFAVKAG